MPRKNFTTCSTCHRAHSTCKLVISCRCCISKHKACILPHSFERIIKTFASRKKWLKRLPSSKVIKEIISECNTRDAVGHREALVEEHATLIQTCGRCASKGIPCEIVVRCGRCVGRHVECSTHEVLQRFVNFLATTTGQVEGQAVDSMNARNPTPLAHGDRTNDQRLADGPPVVVPEQCEIPQRHSDEFNGLTSSRGSAQTDPPIAGSSTSYNYSATFAQEITPMQPDMDGKYFLGTHETLAASYFEEGGWDQYLHDNWHDPFTHLTNGGDLQFSSGEWEY